MQGSSLAAEEPHPSELVGPLGHVEGVELVSLGSVTQVVSAWDRDQPVVLVCRSGGRSGKAALQMAAMGFRRVASMRGGMLRWSDARLPVARTPPPDLGHRRHLQPGLKSGLWRAVVDARVIAPAAENGEEPPGHADESDGRRPAPPGRHPNPEGAA